MYIFWKLWFTVLRNSKHTKLFDYIFAKIDALTYSMWIEAIRKYNNSQRDSTFYISKGFSVRHHLDIKRFFFLINIPWIPMMFSEVLSHTMSNLPPTVPIIFFLLYYFFCKIISFRPTLSGKNSYQRKKDHLEFWYIGLIHI